MAEVRTDPADITTASVVQVDVQAPDNRSAILTIEDWAADHGLARVNEFWLREVVREGRVWYRGICYRVTDEERSRSRAVLEDADKRLRTFPVCETSAR